MSGLHNLAPVTSPTPSFSTPYCLTKPGTLHFSGNSFLIYTYNWFPLTKRLFSAILDSYGCCNKLSQTWWLTTHIYSLTVLEVRNRKSVSLSWNQGISRPGSLQELREEFVSLPFLASRAAFFAFLGSGLLPPSLKPATKHLALGLYWHLLLLLLNLPLFPLMRILVVAFRVPQIGRNGTSSLFPSTLSLCLFHPLPWHAVLHSGNGESIRSLSTF